MSARKYSHRILFAALTAAAVISATPAKAAVPLVVTASRFSITFQDGWTLFPIGTSDTIKFVMNQASGSACYLAAIPQTHSLTAAEMAAYMSMYGGADSLAQTATGTKTLGGKSFTYVEYKSNDSENADGRVRFYYYTTSNLLFYASAIYDLGTAATTITQVEAALATLTLNANSSLRSVALRGAVARPATHDVLGRNGDAVLKARLFRVPAL